MVSFAVGMQNMVSFATGHAELKGVMIIAWWPLPQAYRIQGTHDDRMVSFGAGMQKPISVAACIP